MKLKLNLHNHHLSFITDFKLEKLFFKDASFGDAKIITYFTLEKTLFKSHVFFWRRATPVTLFTLFMRICILEKFKTS